MAGNNKGDDARNEDPEDSNDDNHPVAGCLPFKLLFQVKIARIVGVVEDIYAFPDPDLF